MPGSAKRMEHRGAAVPELKEPKLYAVILHNDDFTTMDFVVEMLIIVFQKTPQDAAVVMTNVHNEGEGIAGVYPFDIAVTKRLLAEKMAEDKNFPLKLSIRDN